MKHLINDFESSSTFQCQCTSSIIGVKVCGFLLLVRLDNTQTIDTAISDPSTFLTGGISVYRLVCVRHLPRTVCQWGSSCRVAAAFEVVYIHRQNSRKQEWWRHPAVKLPASRDVRRRTEPEEHSCHHWQLSTASTRFSEYEEVD